MKAAARQSAVFSIIIGLLLLCDLASLAVLFARLNAYSSDEFENVIPLTESNGITGVTQISYGDSDNENLAFKAVDKSAEWLSETNAEIFRIMYDSENGTTVKSADGDRLIAPGTSNEYVFTLENTGNVLLDYEMTMEAYVTGTDLKIPVTVSLHDYTGKYLLGSEDEKTDLAELNSVDENSKLSAGRFSVYTLEWEWPYEWENDDYDTMLGNLSVNDELALTINIRVIAYADEDNSSGEDETDINGKPSNQYGLEGTVHSPKTGYSMGILPVIMTAALVIMIAAKPKRKGNEE